MQWNWKGACLIALALALALTAAGCSKLNKEFDFDISPNTADHTLIIDPIRKEQKVKVVLTSTGAPVNVYVFLEKDDAAAKKAIREKKLQSPTVLAYDEITEATTLEATIPANSAAVILVSAVAKAAKVKLKITN